ncbi:MAG: EpsG family protein [Leclercia sp.]
MLYAIVFTMISFLSMLETNNTKKNERLFLLFIYFFLLVFFIGARDETGSDWINYYNQFVSGETGYMEIGYLNFVEVFKGITNSYNEFVFFHCLIYLLIFFYVLVKKNNIGLIILMFYSGHLLGMMGANRQIIAIMLCLVAGEFLLNKRKFTFFFIVLFSSLFHSSSLMFILAYPILHFSRKMKIKVYLIFLLIGGLAYLICLQYSQSLITFAINHLTFNEKIATQLAVYTSTQYMADGLSSFLVVVKRMSTLFLILLMMKMFVSKHIQSAFDKMGDRFKFYFACYFFSIIIVLVFQNIFSVIVIRGGWYFYIYEIFLIPMLLQFVSSRNYYLVISMIIIFCAVRFYFQFSVDSTLLLPYKGLWINNDVIRKLY